MPKLGVMAQLSRPFQIALLAFAMLVLAWFFVLHRPGGSSTSSPSPSVSSAAGSSSSGSSSAGRSSSVYHGAAPGVEGLSKDIQKAHGAVATSERNAQELQSKSAQASGDAAGGGASASSATAASHAGNQAKAATGASVKRSAPGPGAQRSAGHAQHAKANSSHPTAATGATAASILHRLTAAAHLNAVLNLLNPALKARIIGAEGVFIAAMKSYLQPASQATVAAELQRHKTVLLLFLNPSSYDDDATAIETAAAARTIGHTVAVHFAQANQVNSFGSITRDIQVYQTPTLLIVTPKRQVTTLTGLTDAYAIKQTVTEARQ
jgi:hypothetical protein